MVCIAESSSSIGSSDIHGICDPDDADALKRNSDNKPAVSSLAGLLYGDICDRFIIVLKRGATVFCTSSETFEYSLDISFYNN